MKSIKPHRRLGKPAARCYNTYNAPQPIPAISTQGAELQPTPWGCKKSVMEIYRETVWPLVGELFEESG